MNDGGVDEGQFQGVIDASKDTQAKDKTLDVMANLGCTISKSNLQDAPRTGECVGDGQKL